MIGFDNRFVFWSILFSLLPVRCTAFVLTPSLAQSPPPHRHPSSRNNNLARSAYIRQPEENVVSSSKKKSLHPRIGDIVRYFDLDGGRADGEVLVGKISYIQPVTGENGQWLVDIVPLEDVGDGYFAELSSQKRRSKSDVRKLESVSPIMASYVQSEAAFKIPMEKSNTMPKVRAEQYDLENYTGPVFNIDETILASDLENYSTIKNKILRLAALAGLAGTVLADFFRGSETAVIYFAGAVASILYLFLLALKTDTIASPEARLGSSISSLRFAMPLIVLVGVALFNQSLGDANPMAGKGVFDLVTPEQFAAAVLGFLTYRIPLFAVQVQEAFKGDPELILPGSTGVVLQMVKAATETEAMASSTSNRVTIFLVSGPQATGRSELVQQLINEEKDRFVAPDYVDRVVDPANYERLEQRGEILATVDGRYGVTEDGIVAAGTKAAEDGEIVMVDASVELSKKLTEIPGLRIVGVWVGLSSVADFERRVGDLIDEGAIEIEEDGTRETTIRSKVREIVKEIEYGISSGVFEFTVLNQDEQDSLEQLREAAKYCVE